MNAVITIGREHGSGGRHIGKIIAKKLGIECYDTRFITEAAAELILAYLAKKYH